MSTVQANAFAWDPFATNYEDDPYPLYEWLRDERPLYLSNKGLYALSRFADVQAALTDWRTFSSAGPPVISQDEDTALATKSGNFIDMDPPAHGALRNVLAPWLNPRVFRSLGAHIQALAERQATQLRGRSETDLSEEIAWHIPIRLVCHMMGLPEADAPILNELLGDFGRRVPGSADIPPWGLAAAVKLREYFTDCIASRRRAGHTDREDIMSGLVAVQAQQQLADEQILDLAIIVLLAGTESSSSMLSNAFFLLAHLPELRARLRSGEVASEAVINEILRLESPVAFVARTLTRDVELHGVTLPVGSRVALLLGAANRDDRVFENPDSLDPARPRKHGFVFGAASISAWVFRWRGSMRRSWCRPCFGSLAITSWRRAPSATRARSCAASATCPCAIDRLAFATAARPIA